MSEPNEEVIGPPVNKKKANKITVNEQDNSEPATPPRRRGRPKGSTSTKPRNGSKHYNVEPTGPFKVKARLRFTSTGPDGSRTYFDRIIKASAGSPTEAATAISIKLGKIYTSWEEVFVK